MLSMHCIVSISMSSSITAGANLMHQTCCRFLNRGCGNANLHHCTTTKDLQRIYLGSAYIIGKVSNKESRQEDNHNNYVETN